MYGFSDLEDRLLGADGVAVLREALSKVRAIEAEMQAGMTAGLAHGDFEQARKILSATKAAESILLNAANPKGA